MKEMIYIRPLRGVVIRPEKKMKPLTAAGAWVANNNYYRKLMRYGDVEEVDPPSPVQKQEADGSLSTAPQENQSAAQSDAAVQTNQED